MTPDEVLDTPAGLLDRMMTAENVYNAFMEAETLPPGRLAEWVTANPAKWDLITRTNGWA
jgi:hypothetical protein